MIRMLLWGLAGVGAGLLIFVVNQGNHWPWSEHTLPGNIAYVVGYVTPETVIGVIVGFTMRKKPISK
jgi:hypothetical protein